MAAKKNLEKSYSNKAVVAKLRRRADALEEGKPVVVTIAGERVSVPPNATVEFEYKRIGNEEDVEIELTWKRGSS